jgi:hypothetical protein
MFGFDFLAKTTKHAVKKKINNGINFFIIKRGMDCKKYLFVFFTMKNPSLRMNFYLHGLILIKAYLR